MIGHLDTDGMSAMQMLSTLLDILAMHGVEVHNRRLNPSSRFAAVLACEAGVIGQQEACQDIRSSPCILSSYNVGATAPSIDNRRGGQLVRVSNKRSALSADDQQRPKRQESSAATGQLSDTDRGTKPDCTESRRIIEQVASAPRFVVFCEA